MIQDLENSKPETNETMEPSPEPSQPLSPRVSINEMAQSHQMLVGFKEGVREGSYQGKHLRDIALGLDFLERMIQQSKMQMDMARMQEKDMHQRAKDAIGKAGGKINEASVVS